MSRSSQTASSRRFEDLFDEDDRWRLDMAAVKDEEDDLDDDEDDLDDDEDDDESDEYDADQPVVTPAPVVSAGRQRRRAAARPAGPPVS